MRGKPIDGGKREEVKAVLYLNPDISQRDLAKTVNLPKTTAAQIMKNVESECVDDFDRIRAEKKQQFINEVWEVIGKALKLTNKRFTKALEDEEAMQEMVDIINKDKTLKGAEQQALYRKLKDLQMTNIRDIAIALGTIYDKQALASGEPTTITERHEPTPDLVQELEKKIQQLKQMTG
jgi:hypothetical protein